MLFIVSNACSPPQRRETGFLLTLELTAAVRPTAHDMEHEISKHETVKQKLTHHEHHEHLDHAKHHKDHAKHAKQHAKQHTKEDDEGKPCCGCKVKSILGFARFGFVLKSNHSLPA